MENLEAQGVLVITGRKGSGKSNLVRALLERIPRSLSIDMHGEYPGCVIEEPEALAVYLNGRGRWPFRVAYRDNGQHGYSWAQVFEMLHALEDCVLVLEEASRWLAQGTDTAVDWFFQHGRHRRISLFVVARRPFELTRLSTSQADVVVSFYQHEPRDLAWIREIGEAGADERVAALGPFQWDYVLRGHPELEALLEGTSRDVEPLEAPPAPPAEPVPAPPAELELEAPTPAAEPAAESPAPERATLGEGRPDPEPAAPLRRSRFGRFLPKEVASP